MIRSGSKGGRPCAAVRLHAASWLVLASLGAAAGAQPAEPSSAGSPARASLHERRAAHTTLDQRLAVLSKELELSVPQQHQVRDILLQQRARVRQIWTNPSIDPDERAPATQAASDKTGDEIRALLSDTQKQKYNRIKPSMPVEPGSRRNVEDWMKQMGPQQSSGSVPDALTAAQAPPARP